MVVADNKPSERVHRILGAVGSDWNFYAREDPDIEDLVDLDFQGAFMVEDPREHRDGFVLGVRFGDGEFGDRDCAEGDHPPEEIVQDELLLC